ncbi:unnamed protein product [Blepharisma stoltei]|uniref:Uncharacterized protein n=1 Tax=Blepharisma stoltei TaxID=1481888 RepID=A0AAU9I511_9CILI|nr:unnamed protein product [Blepharisma stoltei]
MIISFNGSKWFANASCISNPAPPDPLWPAISPLFPIQMNPWIYKEVFQSCFSIPRIEISLEINFSSSKHSSLYTRQNIIYQERMKSDLWSILYFKIHLEKQ